MKIIGITGGVGAGKSEILNYIGANYDAVVIQADLVAHELMKPEGACYQRIVETFSEEILGVDGAIDRRKLGAIVFTDSEKLQALNTIVHPAVKEEIRAIVSGKRSENIPEFYIIEAALLIEDHYDAICDELWYIHTEEAVRRERLKASRGYSDEKITDMMRSQLPESTFYAHCQRVIENSGDREETFRQLREALQAVTEEK